MSEAARGEWWGNNETGNDDGDLGIFFFFPPTNSLAARAKTAPRIGDE